MSFKSSDSSWGYSDPRCMFSRAQMWTGCCKCAESLSSEGGDLHWGRGILFWMNPQLYFLKTKEIALAYLFLLLKGFSPVKNACSGKQSCCLLSKSFQQVE